MDKSFIFNSNVNKVGISNIYNNIGNVYWDQGKLDKALKNYNYSLDIRRELKLDGLIISSLNNIANIYSNKKNQFRALFFYKEAYKMAKLQNDNYVLCISLVNLGISYNNINQYDKGILYLKKAEKLSEHIESNELKQNDYNGLNIYYEKTKQFKKAFETQKIYYSLRELGRKSIFENKIKEYNIKIASINKASENQLKINNSIIEEKNMLIKKLTIYAGLISLFTLIIITILLNRYFKKKDYN